jgi:hypothetical protein
MQSCPCALSLRHYCPEIDESCHAGLDPASISLEGALRAPPWIAGQARNDIDINLPKAREIINAINSLGAQ